MRELEADAGTGATRARTGVSRKNTIAACARSASARPAVFLLVSLRDPERDVASYVSQAAESGPREWWRELRRAFSPHDRRLLKVSELERARVRADQAHARLADYLPVRQARGVELQWLIRRAFCRGLGEPQIDGLHEPRALVFERNGQALLAPLEGDIAALDGLAASSIRAGDCESSRSSGCSWQAQLVLGALPERATFPGARVELMFAPVESLPFANRPVAERSLPAERAGAADRAPAHPGRRSDRQGRVRRGSGGLGPRLSAHAGGARPARLPAGLQPPTAVAGDARDRRRGER